MLRSLLGLILVLWYDLTTMPLSDFLRKYRLVEIPVDGYARFIDERASGYRHYPTGPGVPQGTVYRMLKKGEWHWYAIDGNGTLFWVPAGTARYIRKAWSRVRFRNRLLTLCLLALPPLAAYWLTSLLVGR